MRKSWQTFAVVCLLTVSSATAQPRERKHIDALSGPELDAFAKAIQALGSEVIWAWHRAYLEKPPLDGAAGSGDPFSIPEVFVRNGAASITVIDENGPHNLPLVRGRAVCRMPTRADSAEPRPLSRPDHRHGHRRTDRGVHARGGGHPRAARHESE